MIMCLLLSSITLYFNNPLWNNCCFVADTFFFSPLSILNAATNFVALCCFCCQNPLNSIIFEISVKFVALVALEKRQQFLYFVAYFVAALFAGLMFLKLLCFPYIFPVALTPSGSHPFNCCKIPFISRASTFRKPCRVPSKTSHHISSAHTRLRTTVPSG